MGERSNKNDREEMKVENGGRKVSHNCTPTKT